jgi:hypothetical protein
VTDGGGGVHGAGQDRRLLVAWQVRSQGAMNCSGLSAVKKAFTPAPIAYAPNPVIPRGRRQLLSSALQRL